MPRSNDSAGESADAACLCFANIPIAVRITSQTNYARGRTNSSPPTTLTTRLCTKETSNAYGELARDNSSHGAVGRRVPLAHTKGTHGRTPWQLQPWMRRRVPARAFASACTVLKMILPETHSKKRRLERTTAIDDGPVRGDAGLFDRQLSGAGRHVRGVDDDVVITRIREHHRRGHCRATEVVREECTPGL